MRTIKFRGHNKISDCWVFGMPVKDADVKYRWWIMFNESEGIIIDDPESIGQFTGLYDKNGNEIWEGDILAPMSNDFRPEYRGNWIVVYEEGAFFAKSPNGLKETWIPYWKPDLEIEVIGTVYENPELIK